MTLPELTRQPLAPAVRTAGAILSPEGTAVEVVADVSALEALRPEWDELLAASAAGEIFLTWEWLSTWWRHLGAGRPLAILTVRREGRLSALAPLLVSSPRLRPGFASPTLGFLGSGVVGSDYLDLLVRAGEEEAVGEALAARIDRERPTLDLVQVRSAGSSVAVLAAALERRGWTRLERATHVCPCIDLEGLGWEQFVAGLGPSHRANLRRRLRQAERTPGFAFHRASTPAEVEEAFDTLVLLHRLCWRGRGGSDALDDPAVVGFHREFCRRALERDWLRLYVLWLEGRAAAAIYCFRFGDRFLQYQAGFDPELAGRSVGLVCLGLAIRESIAEGAREFDLLHGSEPYKYLWARRSRRLSRFELFPPTPAGGLRRWLRHAGRQARNGVRRLFPAIGARPQPAGWHSGASGVAP